MANKWPLVAIGDVAEVFDGPHATPKTIDSGPIFLGIGALQNGRINLGETRHVTLEDFKTWTRRVKPKGGDIVFSYETRLGEAAIIPEGFECCLGRRMGLVRTDRARLDPRFFLYLYLSPYFQEVIRSRTIPGATVDRIALKEFPSFQIPLPDIQKQRAIAHILGTLDDKIDLDRQMNETLEAMARALFKSWFVDFDPVRAKMEGRWQRGQSLPGLPAHLYDRFPDRLVKSELGEAPEGWAICSLSQSLTIIGGGTPKTSISEYWGGKIPWFSVADTPHASNAFVTTTEKNITDEGLRNSSAKLIPKGATIISARGTVGNLAIAGCDMTFNQSCYALRGNNGIGDYFVYLRSKQMVEQLKSMAHGSVFSTITRQTFEAIKQLEASITIHQAFEQIVGGWFDKMLLNVQESNTLTALRDTLLPKLISGELRIKDAERFIDSEAEIQNTSPAFISRSKAENTHDEDKKDAVLT